MSQPIIVLGPQRCGTTVLQKTLEKYGPFAAYGEVFHQERGEYRLNFFNYLASHGDSAALHLYPTYENVEKLYLNYFEFLAANTERQYHLVDIKENSLHHFNSVWRDIFEPPTIIKFALRDQVPIFRIKRKNVLAQVLSQDVSNCLKQWHFRPDEPIPPVQIKINTQQYVTRIERFQREGQFVDSCLTGAKRLIEIVYEDMFDEDRISNAVVRLISDTLQLELVDEVTVAYQKSIQNPKEVVSNLDEVLGFFSKTQWAKWAEELFA
jgi:LPS sulfotransferase NodH